MGSLSYDANGTKITANSLLIRLLGVGCEVWGIKKLSGSLFFQDSRFAILENKPTGFKTSLGIQLV